MKIIHSSGKELDLKPGTVLNISRTNPFFNKYGEQSAPVKLPSSDNNRRILNFPDDMGRMSKMPQRNNATIQEGVFSLQCRQAILSADDDEIDTSYYLNTGSFYEKMKDLKLSTIFKNKVINFYSVDEAIQFVRNLFVKPDSRFSCFPALIENQDTGKLSVLNKITGPAKSDGYFYLYNEVERSETVDENAIRVPAGFYITPFIKAKHLLEEIFKYLGYKLESSFFSNTTPFSDMVFLNNNIDTIVNGQIRYDQIVPDCTVSTILDIYRNKFCCEFIPNEIIKSIKIVLFDELMNSKATHEVTNLITKKPVINHAAKYKQLKLSADKGPMLIDQTDADGITERMPATPDYLSKTIPEIAAQYPEAVIDKTRGWIYREGFSADRVVREIIGCINCDYMAEEDKDLEAEKKESPDTLVQIDALVETNGEAPFVGTSRTLNSKIVLDSEPRESSDSTDKSQNKTELKPMLCFTAHLSGKKFDIGTIYAHIGMNERIWDYALCYNGPDGLYEKFWRKYDNMLRNSFRPVTTELLIPETLKLNLPAHEKIILNNQEVLPNVIKYYLGKKKDTECTFLTTKLLSPISSAISENKHFPDSEYRWVPKTQRSDNYKYNWMQLKETPETFFIPPPTKQQYQAGGQYYRKTFACYLAQEVTITTFGNIKRKVLVNKVAGTLTVWLEPIKREY